jgi:serine protease Do
MVIKKYFEFIIIFNLFIFFWDIYAADDLQNKILQAKNKVLPALVHIEPVKEVFSSGKRIKVQVTGSGIIFTPDGYVLTNNHVAEKARLVNCTLANRDEVPAEVIGLDALTDLAVLKLDLSKQDYKNVEYVQFGDSDSLEVGEIVMALGSPLGLSRSLSMGVVSSIDRYFEDRGQMVSPFNLWIQTDAAINPGNSGGPLVNLKGEVIGINARAIFFGENLGFAIPVNTAKLVIERILKEQAVKRSWIGVEWQEIKEYKKYKDHPDLKGVLISYVEEDSPAQKAGLMAGDLVFAIDDHPVSAEYKEELPKIRKFISEVEVGTTITFHYKRANKGQKVELSTAQRGKFEGNEFECKNWGLSVQEITPRIIQNLKLQDEKGVLVSGIRIGSIADEAEIFRGYVIRFVDNEEIQDLEHFKMVYQRLEEIPEKGIMLRLIFRNSTRFALLKEK